MLLRLFQSCLPDAFLLISYEKQDSVFFSPLSIHLFVFYSALCNETPEAPYRFLLLLHFARIHRTWTLEREIITFQANNTLICFLHILLIKNNTSPLARFIHIDIKERSLENNGRFTQKDPNRIFPNIKFSFFQKEKIG